MLDLFVPMPLALSSAPTWVTECGLFLRVFGFGEVCELALCEKCGIWVEYYWRVPGYAGFFSLGTKTIQDGSTAMHVFSLALGKAHLQQTLRVSISVLM